MKLRRILGSPALISMCRMVVGAVFIFSGLAKTLDPWGTAMKLFEYMSLWGMDWMEPILLFFTLAQCVIEVALGVMLVANRGIRVVSLLMLVLMCFFTLLTLYIAVFDPLDDCGCFGEAVKISNWATFVKNVVLLPMSYAVWNSARKKQWAWERKDFAVALVTAALTVVIALYGWYIRVPFDNFGMPVSTNLREDVVCSKCADKQTKILCRNIDTGDEVYFNIDDTEWYDDGKWEYLDTVTREFTHEMLERDFAVWDGTENIADRIVYGEGTTYMVMINKPWKLTGGCLKGIERMLNQIERNIDEPVEVMALTRPSGDGIVEYTKDSINIGQHALPLYTVSTNLYEMMLRADVGVVKVHNGIISDKRFCRSAIRLTASVR